MGKKLNIATETAFLMEKKMIPGLTLALVCFALVSQPTSGLTEAEENQLRDNVIALAENVEKLSLLLENLIAELEAGEAGKTLSAIAFVKVGEEYRARILGFTMENLLKVPSGSQLIIFISDAETGSWVSAKVELTPPLFGETLPMTVTGGFTVSAQNGIAVVPIPAGFEGLWMGVIRADYYQSLRFIFEVVAELPQETSGTTTSLTVFFLVDSPMKIGQPNVIRAVDQGGNLVQGLIKIQDLDAEPAYRIQEGPNPLSFVPATDSFYVSLIQNGEEVASDVLAVPKQKITEEPFPLTQIGAVLAIFAIGLLVWRKRGLRLRLPRWPKRPKRAPF